MDRFTALAKDSSISVRTHYVKPDDFFLRDTLTAVRRNNPDALLVSTFGIQASTAAIRARQSGFAGPIFANNGFALTNENFSAARKAELKDFSYQAYNDPPAAFVDTYRARYGEPPTFFAYLAFQDAELIADALRKSKGEISAFQRYFATLTKFSGTYGELAVSREREILEPTKLRLFSNH